MRTARRVALFGFLMCAACQERSTSTAKDPSASQDQRENSPSSDFQGIKTIADIAKLAWVDKRCRQWAADGDIDIDQTCLVVRTAKGTLVVIPNEYNDPWMKEIGDQLSRTSKDKWIQRFYSVGGGEKPTR
jgi:hypothetical protein